MNLPKFSAESSLSKSTRTYRGSPRFGSFAQSGVSGVMPSQLDEDESGLQADDAGAEEEYDSEEGSEEENGEDSGEDAGEESDEG